MSPSLSDTDDAKRAVGAMMNFVYPEQLIDRVLVDCADTAVNRQIKLNPQLRATAHKIVCDAMALSVVAESVSSDSLFNRILEFYPIGVECSSCKDDSIYDIVAVMPFVLDEVCAAGSLATQARKDRIVAKFNRIISH